MVSNLQKIQNVVAQTEPFSDHVIELKFSNGLYRHWRCGRPDGSFTHSFNVVTWPGWMAVTGDMGSLMLSRIDDMVQFVRGHIESIDYFAEKVTQEIPVKEFSPKKMIHVIQEKIDEIMEHSSDDDNDDQKGEDKEMIDRLEALQRRLDDGDISECEASGEWMDITGDTDPSFRDFTSNFLWVREALIWFVANLKEEGAAQ